MSDLVEQIDALLALNAKGVVTRPVPGLAVELLKRARDALSTQVDGLEVLAWLDETSDAAPGAKGVTEDIYVAAGWEYKAGRPMTEPVRRSEASTLISSLQQANEAQREQIERLSNDQPQWAKDEAANLAIAFVDWLGRDKVDADAEHVLAKSITRALLAAQQRGAERMRERAAKLLNDKGATEEQHEGLTREVQNFYRMRNAIRSLETSE